MDSNEIKNGKYEFMLKAVKQLYDIYRGKHLTPAESKELQLTLYMAIFARHQDNKAAREPFKTMEPSTRKNIVDNCLSRIMILDKKGKAVHLTQARDEDLDFDSVVNCLKNISNIDLDSQYDFEKDSRTISELKENYTQQVFRKTRNSIAHGKFFIDYDGDDKIHFLNDCGSASKTSFEFLCLLDTCDKLENALLSQKGKNSLTEYHQLLDCLKNDKPIEKSFFKSNKGKNLYFNLFVKLVFAYNRFRDVKEYEKFRSMFKLDKPMRRLRLRRPQNAIKPMSDIEVEFDRLEHMRNSAIHHYHSSKRESIRVRDYDPKRKQSSAEFDITFNSIIELSKHMASFDPITYQKNKYNARE